MEAVGFFETSVPTYATAWSHNPVSISNFAKLCHSLIIIVIIIINNWPEAEEYNFTYKFHTLLFITSKVTYMSVTVSWASDISRHTF
jgi:hypothetical protein